MSGPEQEPAVTDRPATIAAPGALHQLPMLRGTPAPQPARRLWPWAVAGLGAVLIGVLIYLQPWVTAPTPVATEIATLAPVTRVLAVNGRIAALQSVDVRALVSGPLAELLVAEGDAVQPGTEIARIDAATQQAILRQAVAGLDAALVSSQQAQATLARTDALGPNVARTALDAAATAAQSAAQEVARARALVDQAQIQLANFTIRAPIAGTVLVLNVNPGQTVDPSTALLTIADLRQLVVETDIDEAYATQIRNGLPAVMQLAGEDSLRDGKISFVSQRVDVATGGLAVQLAFTDPATAPIGLTVTANIVVDQRDAALTLPRAAIVYEGSDAAIFVAANGVATRRRVSVTDWPAARLVVTEGLTAGEVVILDATGIIDGQAVSLELP